MATPLVSVVIPCFNAGAMLRPALRSVFAQTYPNLEIIVVDNNSTDGSRELTRAMAAQSPWPVTLTSCAIQGANHARNHAYDLVRGDYVQWFDADDWLAPNKIERQVDFLERDRSVDIGFCDWIMRRQLSSGEALNVPTTLADAEDQLERVLSQIWYPPHSYLFRRAAADRLQHERGWWPGRRVGTDVEYSGVAALLGLRFRHVAGIDVIYNMWSETQMSGAGTPYARVVASMRDIYLRLATLAERPDIAPRIAARHRTLLGMDWNVWSLPPASVELKRSRGRRVVLRHRASGGILELRPREAAVVDALLQSGGAQAIAHHAKAIALRAGRSPGDIVFIVETLERLRRAQLLTLVARAEPPDGYTSES